MAAEILCADEYLKAGYQILTELARQKEPHQSKRLRRSLQSLKYTYQKQMAIIRKLI